MCINFAYYDQVLYLLLIIISGEMCEMSIHHVFSSQEVSFVNCVYLLR